jgi:predicted acetyltransferase
MPTHRRRGLLTAMMRTQLHDMHERGEPLAALYASEAPIYGRFGYGLATYQAEMEVTRSRAAFVERPPSKGRIRMVDVSTAVSAFARVWERIRPTQPGMLGLDERWWRTILRDQEMDRHGFSAHYRVVYESGGAPTGFALYRLKMDWDSVGPTGVLKLESLMAVDVDAYGALWHYLLGVDLMARIVAEERRVDEPLRFLLADSRQPKIIVQDGIWLRLVDVASALAARRYAVDGRLVVELHDSLCPWNQGRFEIDGGPSASACERCDREPDLELTVADLGAVYLGGNRFQALQEAGRVIERRPGALARADLMFAAERIPWCPSHF